MMSNSENAMIYFWYVDSNVKIFLVLYHPLENFTTCITVIETDNLKTNSMDKTVAVSSSYLNAK